jgi:hypothetical protein
LAFTFHVKRAKELPSKNAQDKADSEIDLVGRCYRDSLLLPHSQFYEAFRPLPSGTLVGSKFAAGIEQYRIASAPALKLGALGSGF